MQDPISLGTADNTPAIRPVKTRRSYPGDLKARIVAECLTGERSVASIALSHGINANLVHKWIRHHRADTPPRMLPVTPMAVDKHPAEPGHIELITPIGTIRFVGVVEER